MFNKLFNRKSASEQRSNRWIFGTMLAFGIVGLLASFVLSTEEFQLLRNPNTILSCNFNLVLNCGAVMKTWEASIFGFPNMFMGLMGFPVIILVALLGLSNVKFPRWFLIGVQIGYTLAAIFAYWLFFSSLYVIQVLCPWCLTVTLSATMLFATATRYNFVQNTFGFKKYTQKRITLFFAGDYDKMIVAGWIVLLIALVIVKFGNALFA